MKFKSIALMLLAVACVPNFALSLALYASPAVGDRTDFNGLLLQLALASFLIGFVASATGTTISLFFYHSITALLLAPLFILTLYLDFAVAFNAAPLK